jgi:hypothetical protein
MPLLPLASSVTGRQLEPSDVEVVAADGFAAAVKNQTDGDALLTQGRRAIRGVANRQDRLAPALGARPRSAKDNAFAISP